MERLWSERRKEKVRRKHISTDQAKILQYESSGFLDPFSMFRIINLTVLAFILLAISLAAPSRKPSR